MSSPKDLTWKLRLVLKARQWCSFVPYPWAGYSFYALTSGLMEFNANPTGHGAV